MRKRPTETEAEIQAREMVMRMNQVLDAVTPEPEPDLAELRKVRARARRARWRAQQRVEELLAVDPKVRHEEAAQDKKYHSVAVLDLLLKRAQAQVLHDPNITRELAELCFAIADGMYPSTTIPHTTLRDYFALAHAHLGNVCRLHCKWEEAHCRYRQAHELLLKGAGDPEIHAQINRMYGTLLKDQRKFPRALQFLEAAVTNYRALGMDHEMGLVLITTSVVHRDMGAADKALQAHMRVCELLDETKAPLLSAAAWVNLAILFCDLEQYEQAESVLENLPSVFEVLPPESTVPLDLMWTRGMVAQGLGDIACAEECYLSVRDAYESRGDLYSSARVSLDLLRAYWESGRLVEVEDLAESVYHDLRAQPLEPETHEAFRILIAARTQRHMVAEALCRFEALLTQKPFPGKRSPTTEP